METYKEWTSCCRGKNCPEVKLDDEFLYVKDDYGNTVKIQRSKIADFSDLLNGVVQLISME